MRDWITFRAMLYKLDWYVRDAKGLYQSARSIVSKPFSQIHRGKYQKYNKRRTADI